MDNLNQTVFVSVFQEEGSLCFLRFPFLQASRVATLLPQPIDLKQGKRLRLSLYLIATPVLWTLHFKASEAELSARLCPGFVVL